jgi:hypothetical protein
VLFGNGDATFSEVKFYMNPYGAYGLTVGDFDNDEYPDVARAGVEPYNNPSWGYDVTVWLSEDCP